MSADPVTWKLTLPCTKAEAEAVAAYDGEIEAVLITTEVDEAAGEWRLDAYFEGEPDAATLGQVRELAASSGWSTAVPEPLSDEDWVAISQQGLEPIREGRFVVHTSAHPGDAPDGGRAFLIDAGQAFGTGHHGTTSGCLAMLDRLAGEGEGFANVIDLGTGTGLLAFAARHLWPAARVAATDIDPIAIDVTRENMEFNGVDQVALVVADGTRDPAIAQGAPYDLVIANILAGPLIAMAPEVAAIAAPGATIVLAGLLTNQAEKVVDAYGAQGATVRARDVRGDWTILCLTAAAERRASATDGSGRGDWAIDA
jgi:ribosomal protein L11 methyltransferase